MKKIFQLLTISALFLMSLTLSAQEFVKGTKMLSIGIGAGDRYYGSGFNMIIPPLQANLDIGVSEKLGIGYIGVGGLIAYSASRYGYDNWWGRYERRYSNLTIGFRGSYHFALDVKGLDLYAGLMIGYNIASYKETFPPNYDKNYRYYNYDRTYGGVLGGLFAGARYMFNDKFGIYGELGYTVSVLSVGVTFKF